MKTRLILVGLITILSACKDLSYRYYTRVNDDGTVFKQIIAEGDSSQVYGSPFSFDTDNGWSLSYDKKVDNSNGDTLFVVIAEKTFESVQTVNNDLTLNDKDSVYKDNISVRLSEQFMGFFNFYHYEETFKQRFPFRHLSIDDYLSQDEYAYFFQGDTACVQHMNKAEINAFEEDGERRFWNYLASSLGIEFIDLSNQYAGEHQKTAFSQADSLLVMQLFQSSVDDGPEIEAICKMLDKKMNTTWLNEAYSNGYFEHFEEQIDNEAILLDENQYCAEVQVPGLLYATNANLIDGKKAQWQFKRGNFLYKDFTLSLEYRTINYWTFIVIGVLLVILLGSFLIKKNS